MSDEHSHEHLVDLLKTPGWRLLSQKKEPGNTGTLEYTVREAHAQKQKGGAPGVIERIENAVVLDLVQIETLWRYLGLPD